MYNESIYKHILFMILYTLSISTIYQSKIDLNTCIYICDLNMNLRLAILSYNVKVCGECSTNTLKILFLCIYVCNVY